MFYEQVKFLDAFDDRILGGIGVFEGGKLVGIVCGECGGFFEADDILWYETMEWKDISNAIIRKD